MTLSTRSLNYYIQIVGKNRWGDDLGITGVYELKYNTDATVHEYLLLNPNKAGAKIERVDSGEQDDLTQQKIYYWVVKDSANQEVMRSGRANCPQNAALWGVVTPAGEIYNPSGSGADAVYNFEWENADKHIESLKGVDTAYTKRTKNYPEISVTCSSGK